MSDTPRTDALLLKINEGRVYTDHGAVTNLAFELEREVAALRDACQVALDEFAIGNFNAARRQKAVEFIRATLGREHSSAWPVCELCRTAHAPDECPATKPHRAGTSEPFSCCGATGFRPCPTFEASCKNPENYGFPFARRVNAVLATRGLCLDASQLAALIQEPPSPEGHREMPSKETP